LLDGALRFAPPSATTLFEDLAQGPFLLLSAPLILDRAQLEFFSALNQLVDSRIILVTPVGHQGECLKAPTSSRQRWHPEMMIPAVSLERSSKGYRGLVET
jgi:hypothetical protein